MSRYLSGKDKQSPAISVPTLMAGHKKSFSGRFRQTKKPVFADLSVPLGKTGQYLHTTLTLLFHSEIFPTGVFHLFCEFQTKHCKVRQSHKPLLKKEKLPFSYILTFFITGAKVGQFQLSAKHWLWNVDAVAIEKTDSKFFIAIGCCVASC